MFLNHFFGNLFKKNKELDFEDSIKILRSRNESNKNVESKILPYEDQRKQKIDKFYELCKEKIKLNIIQNSKMDFGRSISNDVGFDLGFENFPEDVELSEEFFKSLNEYLELAFAGYDMRFKFILENDNIWKDLLNRYYYIPKLNIYYKIGIFENFDYTWFDHIPDIDLITIDMSYGNFKDIKLGQTISEMEDILNKEEI